MTCVRDVVILGATGSVGTQAIEVIRANPDRFRVTGLAASGSNPAALAASAIELQVQTVAVARATVVEELTLHLYAEVQRRGLSRVDHPIPKVIAGPDSAAELAASPCDVVLNAVSGSVGLAATLEALKSGATLALANKESLIAGGRLVTSSAKPGQIVPVDSEHSAIAQCLRSGTHGEVRRLVLTASGGPFRGRKRAELADVTLEQALAHPTWNMGPAVTINSATMVNKGLELIEAHLLFDVPADRIDVVVHPQSIVHSMVEFHDGATIAQCSPPDMRLPISLGLGWPDRVLDAAPGMDWTSAQDWTFEPVDDVAFPAVLLAKECARTGGVAPAVYNAANEEAMDAFIAGRLGFTAIVDVITETLDLAANRQDLSQDPASLQDVADLEAWVRPMARSCVESR